MTIKYLLAAMLLALSACGGQGDVVASEPTPSLTETPTEATTPSTSPSHDGVPPLPDGPVTPGRYRFEMTGTCAEDMGCPTNKEPALPTIEIAVPEGWEALLQYVSLFPSNDTTSRNEPALTLGWTNFWASLYSQPCHGEYEKPDMPVGPTAADLVDAVVAHPLLNVTTPKPVKLGKHRGQHFKLVGPKDISDCGEWRPWDPAPYLQGNENEWELWVMDVEKIRVVIGIQYFPETPEEIKAELRLMAESVRFRPSKA